jgi:hypothetical protein
VIPVSAEDESAREETRARIKKNLMGNEIFNI